MNMGMCELSGLSDLTAASTPSSLRCCTAFVSPFLLFILSGYSRTIIFVDGLQYEYCFVLLSYRMTPAEKLHMYALSVSELVWIYIICFVMSASVTYPLTGNANTLTIGSDMLCFLSMIRKHNMSDPIVKVYIVCNSCSLSCRKSGCCRLYIPV